MLPKTGLILGIESSCDETAAAVVHKRHTVLSSVVASQVALHAAYGGVVPELASREHLRNIVLVVRAAIVDAGITFADLDAIAVTEGPGLAGALLAGILYAKGLAFGLGKPLVAVNHLEGHIHGVLMDLERNAAVVMPLLALVVSGGHTHLYLIEAGGRYRNIGSTVDDAAGEAFDKVAKLLGLGYPGGPWIDALAPHGNPAAVPFHFHEIKPRVGEATRRFDFSFSGIKSAVLRYVRANGMRGGIGARQNALAARPAMTPAELLNLCDATALGLIASFQAAVIGNLVRQTFAAAATFGVRGVLVSGGVAANRGLRERFTGEAAQRGLPVAFPSISLSTDNAAMIAAAAWGKYMAGDHAKEDMTAAPQLRLG